MTTEERPLSWQNLIFYIPLAAGLYLVVGSALSSPARRAPMDSDQAALDLFASQDPRALP